MSKCRYCGKAIIWAKIGCGRPIALEEELTGYIKEPGAMDALATKEGYPIRGARIARPGTSYKDVDGYAHKFHAQRCPGRRRRENDRGH